MMLCTVIWDVYDDGTRADMWEAMRRLLPDGSRTWSPKGIYAYWDPATHDLLYVGLAANLPERFAQHNKLVSHSGGNKSAAINDWFSKHETLGFTLIIQSAAVQIQDQLSELAVGLGANSSDISRIAEGQLIELHRRKYRHWPPWNRVGGSVQGASWARPEDKSVLGLLSAAEESLFVARRSLRTLSGDAPAQRFEALIHTARMRALMELHDADPTTLSGMSSDQRIEEIKRVLMLGEGKLVDDLTPIDDLIRTWVGRLADASQRQGERELYLREANSLSQVIADDKDLSAIEFIASVLQAGSEDEDGRDAREVLRTGYLDDSSHIQF
jgi:hypothetical protein